MRLLNAHLVEVCQHQDLKVDFTPGLTLIVGQNGAGKSNLVNLVRASLTNDFSSMGGVKKDNIRRLKADGVPSFVESTWSTPSGVLTVRRGLASCRSMLTVDGEEVCSGKEDDITKELLRRTNLSAAKINDFLFADQDRLQDVIGGSKSRRAELFTSLCGIEVMSSIDRALRDVASADRALVEDFDTQQLDQSILRWQELVFEIRRLAAEAEQLSKEVLPPEQVDSLQKLLASRKRIAEMDREFRLVRDRIRKAKETLERVNADEQSAAAELGKCRDMKEKLSARVSDLTHKVQQVRVENDAAEQYRAAVAVKKKPEPLRPEFREIDEQRLQNAIFTLAARVDRLNKLLKLAAAGDLTECESCGTPIEVIADHVPEYQTELEEKQGKLDKAQAKLRAYLQSKKAYEQYVKQKAKWDADRDAAIRVIARTKSLYPKSPPKVSDEAQLRSQLNEAKQELGGLSTLQLQLEQRHKAAQEKALSTEARLSADRDYLAQLREKLQSADSEDAVTENAEENAQAKLDQHRATETKLYETRGTLQSLRTEAKMVSRDIRRLRSQKRRLARTSEWVGCVERARLVLKKDRLPARMINNMLGRTTAIVNDYLEQLGVSYRVEAEVRDFAFEAIHVDGTREPASRLSVGQKTCLAIAFWLARAEVFIGSLPFFCLDEPTAHLDTSRVASVADLFGVLAARLYKEGRQGIVITHHAELSRVATSTIKLS